MKIKTSLSAIAVGVMAVNCGTALAAGSLEDAIAHGIFDGKGSFANVAVNDAFLDASVEFDDNDLISMQAVNTATEIATNAISTSVLGAANTGSLRIGLDQIAGNFSSDEADSAAGAFTGSLSWDDDKSGDLQISGATSESEYSYGIDNDGLFDVADETIEESESAAEGALSYTFNYDDALDIAVAWNGEEASRYAETDSFTKSLIPDVRALNAAYNSSTLDASIEIDIDYEDDGNAGFQNIDFSTSATGAVLSGDLEIGIMGTTAELN